MICASAPPSTHTRVPSPSRTPKTSGLPSAATNTVWTDHGAPASGVEVTGSPGAVMVEPGNAAD